MTPFVKYGAGNTSGGTFTLQRCGKIITISGVASVNSAMAIGVSEQQIGTIPEGYRPSVEIRAVMQGSGINRWLIVLYPNGTLSAGRYGISSYETLSAQTSSSAGTWLPFSLTYICA